MKPEPVEPPSKVRLRSLLQDYDWRKLPHRVASSMHSDLSHLVWTDEKNLFIGTGNERVPIEVLAIEKLDYLSDLLPNPYYRGNLTFYPISKKTERDGIVLKPCKLDPGYLEFFFDIIAGTLGVCKGFDGMEVWRRVGRVVDHIENIEDFYGVPTSKQAAGINGIFMDALRNIPSLAPLRVCNGIAIGDTLYGTDTWDVLEIDQIPKHIVEFVEPDMIRARKFFDKVCPDKTSQHNLMMATVYPYYKYSNEKFFILKGIGGTGKSRYMEHFKTLIGNKYSAVDLAGLASAGFERSTAIARLQSKLVLHAPDSKMSAADKIVNELKRLATGDRMIGRTIGNNAFEFAPSGSLFVDTNERVNLDNSDAIMRRRVGIKFTEKRLTEEEFNPFYEWVTTLEGAVSIFMYAYLYYVEGCESKFTWNFVDVNDDMISDDLLELAYSLVEQIKSGSEKPFIEASVVKGANSKDKDLFFTAFGLVSSQKKVKEGGTTVNKRVYYADPILVREWADRNILDT